MDTNLFLFILLMKNPLSLAYGVSFFTSSACRQCHRFNKVYNTLVESYPNLDFEKIYINETTKYYAQKHKIKSIPILLFGEGKESNDRILGVDSNYETIKKKCENLSSLDNKTMLCCKNDKSGNDEPEKLKLTKEHLMSAKFCKSVYNDTFLRSCEEFIDHPNTDVQVGIIIEGSTLIICFRGSDNIVDWKNNFRFDRSEFPHGSKRRYHTGFLLQYLSVKHELIEKIERVLSNHRIDLDKIIFTGHSAGGQCTIAAYDLMEFVRDKHGLELQVVTFGSPRLCNSEFEEHFESSIDCTRYVNDRDIITRLPMKHMGGYRHLGKVIQMRNNQLIYRDTSVPEALSLLFRGIWNFDVGVKDHDIEEYIKNIEKWL